MKSSRFDATVLTLGFAFLYIPIIILVGMAVPIAKTLIEIEDMGKVELNVKVTGYQWTWEYEYLGQNVSFFSTLDAMSKAARQLGSGLDPTSVEH